VLKAKEVKPVKAAPTANTKELVMVKVL